MRMARYRWRRWPLFVLAAAVVLALISQTQAVGLS
jgi:hypothetical protein